MLPTRRDWLKGGLAAAGALAHAQVQGQPRRSPNFLFLLTDDQRFDTVAALGDHSPLQTPNMDRLAQRGVAFTQCTTQGGLSGAICMPSRAQILTGKTVFQVHQALVDRPANPDPAAVTFPERLRRAGYTTFHAGKWHLGPALFHRSFGSGAEIFFGGMTDQRKVGTWDYDPSGRYAKADMHTRDKFSSELFADAATGFLRERRGAQEPFLLSVGFTSPHDPRTAPPQFARLFPPERVQLPPNFLPQHPFDNGEMKVRDELLAPFPRTAAEIRNHIAAYYAMVAEVDAQIGRVLDALESSGQAANTYVVFAGDNGLAVGQHGLLGKQNLYDHSLRVPLIVTGPGIPAGKRDPRLCHLLDIAPTVCEWAGVDLPSVTEGRSLFRGRRRDATMSAYRDVQRGLRTREWKLIEYRVDGQRTTQLFDLNNDPWEMRNLSADPAQAARIRTLRQTLAEMLRAAGDRADWVR